MGAFNLSSLAVRSISAIILIPIVVFAVVKGGFPFTMMMILLALISLVEWFSMARKTDQFFLALAKGALYLGVGFMFCVLIRLHFGVAGAVLFLVMLWASDIGAYVMGKLIGGPKLAPMISPNKTWAGLLGAVGFSVGFGLVFYFVSPYLGYLSVLAVLFAGLCVALIGQAGDLLVSSMKRRAQIKDTGALIPGHGGLLDRIDGLLAAAPAYYVIVIMLGSF